MIPGMALRLNCSTACLPVGATVTWSLLSNRSESAVALPMNGDEDNYVTSVDNGLVVLSVDASKHAGTFQCMYNNVPITRHRITLSGILIVGLITSSLIST